MSAPGELLLNESSVIIGNIDCEDIISKVQLEQSLSTNLDSQCNGYQNLMPNFIKIPSGTCESNGYQE